MTRAPLLLLSLLYACGQAPENSRAPLTQAAPELGAGEVLLDARGQTQIVGRVLEGPPGSDADRVLLARGAGLDERAVLDARFVGELVVVLDQDHALRALDAGRERLLDERVEAPLSVVGDTIAYVRGEMPDFEVVRAVPATGEVHAVAPDLRPAWSPALSPDGHHVLFVTSVSGSPRLYRTDRGFIDAPRFPTMPGAPVWRGEELVLWDERGVAWIDVTGGQVLREDEQLSGLLATADGRMLARRDEGYEVLR